MRPPYTTSICAALKAYLHCSHRQNPLSLQIPPVSHARLISQRSHDDVKGAQQLVEAGGEGMPLQLLRPLNYLLHHVMCIREMPAISESSAPVNLPNIDIMALGAFPFPLNRESVHEQMFPKRLPPST